MMSFLIRVVRGAAGMSLVNLVNPCIIKWVVREENCYNANRSMDLGIKLFVQWDNAALICPILGVTKTALPADSQASQLLILF
jgi:hypothetical protein